MTEWAAVVLAAGKGTRMKSALPKVLHPLCGQPMARHILDALRAVGVTRTTLVVGHGAGQVRAALGSDIRYAEQPRQLGTGHALLQARQTIGHAAGDVLVLCGDTPLIAPSTLRSLMERHRTSRAALTLLTCDTCPTDGLGRIERDASGRVTRIVEEKDAGPDVRALREVNAGVYCFRAAWLWPALASLRPHANGEIYLTDLVEMAVAQKKRIESVVTRDPLEALGVNDRVQLARAEAALRQRIREDWMRAGVTMKDPPSTFIDAHATIGQDTVLQPGVHLWGKTAVGRACAIGPNTVVADSVIGDRCRIVASVVERSTVEDDVDIGPFSHLRDGAHIGAETHIGNFAEVKKSRLGRRTKMGHFSYIGDATVGRDVNIGAGTITCNYDGVRKNPTVIEDNVFIGSDTMLVAPVRLGARSVTGAGSVVNRDVPPDKLAVGVPARLRSKKPTT